MAFNHAKIVLLVINIGFSKIKISDLYKSCLVGFLFFFILGGCKPRPAYSPILSPQPSATNFVATYAPSPFSFPIPEPSNTPDPTPSGQQGTRQYLHPARLFSFSFPDNWTESPFPNGVEFTNDQQKLIIDLVNTGYILDSESFARFIETEEEKRNSSYENAVEVTRQPMDEPNSLLVTKEFLSAGARYLLDTYYFQQDQVIMTVDFICPQSLCNDDQKFITSVISSIKINPDAKTRLILHSLDEAATYINDFFSILYPHYWSITRIQDESTIIDTITSPDDQALIQVIVYDDKQFMTKRIAGDFVLTLIRENYAKDVTVETDELLADGREKLGWRTNSHSIRGITTFTAKNSAFFVITVMWGEDPEKIYQDLLNTISDSYKLLDAGL